MRLWLLFWVAACAGAQCRLEVDVDGDGRVERFEMAAEKGPLVLHQTGVTKPLVIDANVTSRECYWLEILGRRGIAVLPFGMQVRFYEYPGNARKPWPYRDIYSFYTASWQGGLIQADVNGDGLPDLFCGNYWIESPKSFELPWRLYAINAYHEHPLSASAQLHWDGKRLLWVESKRPQGRVVWFRPPEDRRQLWLEEPDEANRRYDCPQLKLVDGKPVISASTHRCP
jgi:hypothetical protein